MTTVAPFPNDELDVSYHPVHLYSNLTPNNNDDWSSVLMKRLDDAQHTETDYSNAEGLGQNGYVPSTSMSEDKIPLPPDEPKHEKPNKPLECARPLKTRIN